MNTTVLALALALAPEFSPPRASFDVADAELETGDNSAHLLAYDSDGEVTAEIVLWVDSDDRTRVDVVFADGLYQSTTIDGESVTTETDDAAEVAARVDAIDDWLATRPPQEGLGWCAGGVAMAAVGCTTGQVGLCLGGLIGVTCNCVPLLVEGVEC